MLKKQKHIYGIIFTVIVFLSACGIQQQAVVKPKEHKSPQQLAELLEENEFDYESFRARVATKIDFKNEKYTLKTSLRIRKDSAIWVSLRYLSAPIANVVITPDSIKVIHKREKYYQLHSFDFFNKTFNSTADYYMLQDLLVGNAVGFDSENKYKSFPDSLSHVLSSHSKRKLKKIDEKLPKNEEELYVVRYWLPADNFKTNQIVINDLSDSTSLSINYDKFEEVNGKTVPDFSRITIKSVLQTLILELSYSRQRINTPVEMPFIIPESYEKRS